MKSLLSLGALLVPGTLLAAAELDPVVVVARGEAQSADAVLAAVTVIDRAEIERAQALDIAELLTRVPGVDVVRNGGPGQLTSVFIRGAESNHTLVLIDGVRVNPATAGGAQLQHIDPAIVERIEVLRGPRSTVYGSDALGGVINIVTRRADGPAAYARLQGGSHDSVDANVGLRVGRGDARLALDVGQLDSDGYPTCEDSTLDRGYDRTSAHLRGATSWGRVRIEAGYWIAQGTTDYLDYCGAGHQPVSQDYRNDVGRLSVALSPLPRWSTTLTLTRGNDDIEQNDVNFSGGYDRVRTERPAVRWDNHLQLAAGTLGLGGEWQREAVRSQSFGTVIDDTRERRRVWLQHTGDAARHHWLAGVSHADDDGADATTTYNVEYGLDLRDTTRLIAALGSGYRAPDVTDLYGFGGNPQLEAETSRSVELGLRQQLGAGQRVELRLFRQDIDDLISVEYDPANDPDVDFGYRAVNIDETENLGAELSWELDTGAWRARLAAAYQDPRDASDDSRLLRRARSSASAALVRQWARAQLGADLQAFGDRADIDAQSGAPVVNGGYALVGVDARVALPASWSLAARVDNLLDRDYQTVAGYRSAGTEVWVTLGYDWP